MWHGQLVFYSVCLRFVLIFLYFLSRLFHWSFILSLVSCKLSIVRSRPIHLGYFIDFSINRCEVIDCILVRFYVCVCYVYAVCMLRTVCSIYGYIQVYVYTYLYTIYSSVFLSYSFCQLNLFWLWKFRRDIINRNRLR